MIRHHSPPSRDDRRRRAEPAESPTALPHSAPCSISAAAVGVEAAATRRQLQDEDGDVDADQREGGRRPPEADLLDSHEAAPARTAGRRTSVLSLEHSGQRMPTEVGVMQSPQIGRSQREQETRVSRSGWR